MALISSGRLLRKAIFWATVTSAITQTEDSEGCTLLSIAHTATGGIKGETDNLRVDGAEYSHNSVIFGTQKVRTSWLDLKKGDIAPGVATGEHLDPYLIQDWLEEEKGSSPGQILLQVMADTNGWTAKQVWGFALVDGKRHHVKRCVVKKGEKCARIRVVYELVA